MLRKNNGKSKLKAINTKLTTTIISPTLEWNIVLNVYVRMYYKEKTKTT